MKVDGVSIGREKNEAPEMFENVLVFGGLTNPADGMFRNLVFSSQHGELSHFYCFILTRYHCRKYWHWVTDIEIFLHQISRRSVPLLFCHIRSQWTKELSLAVLRHSLSLDWPVPGQWQRRTSRRVPRTWVWAGIHEGESPCTPCELYWVRLS